VDAIFVGRERAYNRRFQQMCGHYLVEPVACTPASGWEKGQVENQVGTVRQNFFAPRVRVRSLQELNDWLADRCVEWAKARPHPEIAGKTVWEVFEAERASLVPYRGPFDGFHAIPAAVSKTCLVRFDSDEDQDLIQWIKSLRNKYSVDASAVGRPVEIRAYAERIEIRQEGRIVAEHARAFGRGGTIYDPWRYVPILARKPGALRNGAPFKDWALPAPIERIRRKLKAATDGDRQTVEILSAALTDGLPAVEAACAEALEHGVHSADPPPWSSNQWRTMAPILNILARRRDTGPPPTIATPEALRLACEPVADCARYDSIRRAV
jgi:hypothetical protein